MNYQRVIPRDLFNEAKLLKSLGQLALLLHDYPRRWPLILDWTDEPENGFQIEQDPSSGHLCCTSLTLYQSTERGLKQLALRSHYNSRAAYPLFCETNDEEVEVFDELGRFTTEFLELIGQIQSPLSDTLHDKQEATWNGDWFEDHQQNLYIVPTDQSPTKGPNNEIKEAIDAARLQQGCLTQEDQENIGLFRIPDHLKRFTPQNGYYPAKYRKLRR